MRFKNLMLTEYIFLADLYSPDCCLFKVNTFSFSLGLSLLCNLKVQSESGFGTGVLTHIMLSGSESDKLYCVLSLPLIIRYVSLSLF